MRMLSRHITLIWRRGIQKKVLRRREIGDCLCGDGGKTWTTCFMARRNVRHDMTLYHRHHGKTKSSSGKELSQV